MNIRSVLQRSGHISALACAGCLAIATFAATPVSAQDFVKIPFEEAQFFPTAEGSPVEIAVLWGDPVNGPAGVLLRLPAGFPGAMHYHSQDYRGVVISGLHTHWLEGDEPGDGNGPGTYYFQPGGQVHADANFGDEPVVIFIFLPDGLDTMFVE